MEAVLTETASTDINPTERTPTTTSTEIPVPTADGFAHLSAEAESHFALHLYAAVLRLVRYLQQVAEIGGEDLDKVFERHPFLGAYFEEMRPYLPDELTWGAAQSWWRREIADFETRARSERRHLPLLAISGFDARLAFLLVGLVEEDARFGGLFAEMQAPRTGRRPTLELVARTLDAASGDPSQSPWQSPWQLCRPLLEAGLLQAEDRDLPRPEWTLRVPPAVWDAARGRLDERPAPGLRHLPPEDLRRLAELVLPDGFARRLAQVPDLVEHGRVRALVLRCDPGSDGLEVLGAVARALGRGLLVVEADTVADMERRVAGPLAALGRAMPVLTFDPAPGETVTAPELAGYSGPVGFLLGRTGALADGCARDPLTLELPRPSAGERRTLWRQGLGETGAAWRDGALDTVVERFHLGSASIREAARLAGLEAALDGTDSSGGEGAERSVGVAPRHVRAATSVVNRRHLDALADRMPARGGWHDLVVGSAVRAKLDELDRRCRHRERLLSRLGAAFEGTTAGVRALFTGPSGTGKTLAARILASELALDLYRIDLAAVISKYIGETEKNLHRVLSRAESLDVVLLLDEGDALLGQRTDLKNANDRYANLETNYLLQRLEHYRGIVVVTTNLGKNIDSAFQRRMDVVVPFAPPRGEERLPILELHLPEGHEIDIDFLRLVARRCSLHGGQLRNAALHAALLALDDGDAPVASHHLDAALRSEYRKTGGTFPLGGDLAAHESKETRR